MWNSTEQNGIIRILINISHFSCNCRNHRKLPKTLPMTFLLVLICLASILMKLLQVFLTCCYCCSAAFIVESGILLWMLQQLTNHTSFWIGTFYTLLIEGILVLSIRVGRIEILIWNPRFLGDIWSARNSKTFELFLSVRPSVRSNHDCVRTQRACISHRPVGIENGLYRPTGSGNSHINQTCIPGSWAYGKSDTHQIWYSGLDANSK